MRRSIPVLTTAALVALTGCGAATPGAAHQRPAHQRPAHLVAATAAAPGATITTTGTGTVSGTPDVMTAQVGVENTGARVTSALGANDATSTAVQSALERQGIRTADIQTSQLQLYAQRGHNGVTGYHVSDVVTVTIHDLSKAGRILDDALAAAGDAGRLDGVSFSVADDNPALAQARQKAVAAAHADAEQLAGAAGLTLRGLRSITDQTGGYATSGQASSTSAGGVPVLPAVPLQPGTQDTTVQVAVVWAVGP